MIDLRWGVQKNRCVCKILERNTSWDGEPSFFVYSWGCGIVLFDLSFISYFISHESLLASPRLLPRSAVKDEVSCHATSIIALCFHPGEGIAYYFLCRKQLISLSYYLTLEGVCSDECVDPSLIYASHNINPSKQSCYQVRHMKGP